MLLLVWRFWGRRISRGEVWGRGDVELMGWLVWDSVHRYSGLIMMVMIDTV